MNGEVSSVETIPRVAMRLAVVSAVLVASFFAATGRREDRPRLRPDFPDEAMRFRRLQMQDENGLIPDGALMAAKQQMDLARWYSELPPVAGITPQKWTWLGPGNIGGRTRAIAVNPGTPSVWFAGSVGGGIWKTTDSGGSWAPVNDFMASLAVSSIVFQPGNPSIMYAGTGEGFFNSDGLQGAGLFKSTDGGTTWNQLSFTNNANFNYVNRLSISPDGAVLLAATRSGLWRSTDGGTSFATVLNKYFGIGIADVDFSPTNSSAAVASDQYGDAWYSPDGGVTWTPATGLGTTSGQFQRIEVAWAPSSPSTVYAVADINKGTLYRSDNGGATYGFVSTPAHLGYQGWYDNALWVDPTNANFLVVGGLDLWRSTNGGLNFTQISAWQYAPNSAHADHHVIVSLPGFRSTNTSVLFGNDGGVYMTTNIDTVGGGALPYTSGWSNMNHNYGVTQYYGVAGNATSGAIAGGTQDNGTLRYTPAGGPQSHTAMYGGDGGFMAADPTDPNYFYGEYVYLRIFRSTNGGAPNSGADVSSTITDPAYFIAPFILDLNNPNTMLGGATGLWRSTAVKAPSVQFTQIRPALSNNYAISAIAVARGNSDVCWLGYGNGEVWYSTNCTAPLPGWTRVDLNPGPLPKRYVTRIEIDPSNFNHVYAAFGGYTFPNLWHTTDGGASWSSGVSGSGFSALPAAPVRDIKIMPGRPSWVYAATDLGVLASQNGGASWNVPQDGPANVAVDELAWVGQSLVAATHGRGLYKVTPLSRTVSDFNGDGRAEFAMFRPSTATWYVQGQSPVAFGAPADIPVIGDYDGDGDSEVAVFHPATGIWDIQGAPSVPFGTTGDIPVPADYDGDGKTDITVFRPSNGTWFINGQGAIPFGTAGDVPVPGDYNGSGRSQIAVYRRGIWYVLGQPGVAWGAVGDLPVPADYNGDGRTDIAIFRPATGTWFVRNLFSATWGANGDLPVPQDLDGDGRVELIVFRPPTATWFAYNTGNGTTVTQPFGAAEDIPVLADRFRRSVSGDFDGDRRSELTLFRPSDTRWRSLLSSTQFASGPTQPFGADTDTIVSGDFLGWRRQQRAVFRSGAWFVEGGPSIMLGAAGDRPVAADYDGDGRTDAAVFRDGGWTVAYSSSNFTTTGSFLWGTSGDLPAAGDYDGDGRADLAVFRDGAWYVLFSVANYSTSAALLWGTAKDVPVPGDYDGDGRCDVAVYRPGDGAWFMRASSNGAMLVQVFGGMTGDVPVPGDYDGDGRTDVAILRGGSMIWHVLAQFSVSFGLSGDIPLLRRP
jgi:hypothetical protein